MPYLQYRDQRVALTKADQVVGAVEGAALRIPGDDPTARAIVRIGADGTGVILKASPDSVVYVNGVQLGSEPAPILHGDKVEIGGVQLNYGDDAKGGSTQFVSAASIAEQIQAAAAAPRKATSATGGRLVSLVDGREYVIPAAGVTLGREIGNDVVIASGDVSRRHAQIAPATDGYVLTDLSTNGVLVNGIRVNQRQVLGRGDVIRLGSEEFRFYADKVKESAAGVPPSAATVAPAPTAAPSPPPALAGASATPTPTPVATPAAVPPPPRLAPAVPAPVAPAPPPAATAVRSAASAGSEPLAEAPTEPKPLGSTRVPLAVLEVINEGPIRGTIYEIFTPLTNVGRGPHNDVAIADDSVSESHAKILRRDGHWYVVDQGSTNGTYVGGRRVQGEQQLVGSPDVRFGNIKVTFRPSRDAMDIGGSTRAIAPMTPDQLQRLSARHKGAPVASAPHKPDQPIVIPDIAVPEKKKGCAAMIAFVIAAGAVGTGLLGVLLAVRS